MGDDEGVSRHPSPLPPFSPSHAHTNVSTLQSDCPPYALWQLLNCVALAFLPEVDRAMVTIAKSVRPSVVDVAIRKLEIFKRDWPDSNAREQYLEFTRLGTYQSFVS